ncbi:TonB-dependent receptor [candidate division KSB1 bacterium]|nr:TonB-dependent receptor [candidate division KSB1 bacterium]
MIKYASLMWISYAAFMPAAFAQESSQKGYGVIAGKIYDAGQQLPLELATAILFRQQDSAMVLGAAAKADGGFRFEKISAGAYYLEIQFLGFKKKRIANIALTPERATVDLGKILLQQTTLSMAEVEVQAEAHSMSYQLDKKVISVGKQQTAASGTLVEVLENVPSITVDLEGNVSLRGSSNFTVLVDGRPSVLEPSEALQQIPASTVENIEIITNPSAKYNPEGTSGIINIVLKKDRRQGISGLANLNAGVGDKYGGDFLYDYRDKNYQATLGVDYNRRLVTGARREENETTLAGRTSSTASEGDSRRQDNSLGLRSELRLTLGTRDVASFGARYGWRDNKRGAALHYLERSDLDPEAVQYRSASERDRERNFYAMHTAYQHRFAPEGHELSAEMSFSRREGEEATTHNLRTLANAIFSGQRTTEDGPSQELRAKLDYTLPVGEKGKLEAGYQSELERSEDRTGLYEYEATQNEYVLLPQFSNRTRYDENVHALYALYAGAWKSAGYQIGLRGELTDRAIVSQSAGQRFTIAQWDYFPAVHLSNQIAAGHQIMASYTRRIDRPGGGELEPFQTWTDAYNVRVGDPALRAEYLDSYEAGYQATFERSLWSIEAYYRKTHNKIEDVRSVYADNVTLHSAANIGSDYAFGSELLLNYDFSKNWTANLTGNLYRYRIEGALFGEAFARESFNWNTRLSNTLKLRAGTQLQLDANYNSPSISTQGRREGFFTANAAIKQEFFGKLLSATLQVRDLFRSAKYEHTSAGADFYNYSYSTREAPAVMLNLKYNFNSYKPERDARPQEQEEEAF